MTRATPALDKLERLLLGRGDVEVTCLYAGLGGPQDRAERVDDRGRWYPQSWLSRYIKRLNERLEMRGLKVEPGEKKRTYRLVSR